MKEKTVTDRLGLIQGALEDVPEDGKLSSYEKRKRKSLVNELLLLQVWAAQISECLSAQRAQAAANPRLSKFPHVAYDVLKDRISRKPGNRFYNVQKAFSLPQDYLMLPDWPTPESWESQAILDAVIHPEKLPTDFLNGLGFAVADPKRAKSNEYVAASNAKIAIIPALKKMLANSVPLGKTSAWRSRAFALVWTSDSPDGKIVAFQDSSTRQSKRKNNLNTYVKTYPDAFAYLRSRYYAENFLSEREIALRRSSVALSTLIVQYDANPGDVESVEKIRGELSSRKTFFEQRAYLDRLLSVELRNRSQDRLRIKWALSDVQKSFLERMGKRLAMESQAKSVEASIESENAAWKAAYRALSSLFEADAEWPLAKVSTAVSTLKAYSLTDSAFPVRPFSSIRATFVESRKELELARAGGKEEACSKALKNLDYLLRSQAYWLFCFWLEHAFKTDSLVEGGAESEKLSTVVDRRLARIESMVFSWLDETASKSGRFQKYHAHITTMREFSDRSEYAQLVDFLETQRKTL